MKRKNVVRVPTLKRSGLLKKLGQKRGGGGRSDEHVKKWNWTENQKECSIIVSGGEIGCCIGIENGQQGVGGGREKQQSTARSDDPKHQDRKRRASPAAIE